MIDKRKGKKDSLVDFYYRVFLFMKSKESIKLKWDKKLVEMRKKAELKYSVLLSNRKKWIEKNWAYEIEKNERKKRAYINKKE